MADNSTNDQTEKKKRENIALLRNAMTVKAYKEVRRLCAEVPEGALQRISIYDDTVLHIAAHSGQEDLLLDLVKMIPEDRNHQLSDIKNSDGNTILHEVATSSHTTVALELLKRDGGLLTNPNQLGEKPIFVAAHHGRMEMFWLLSSEMQRKQPAPEQTKDYLQRKDETTVLHISIATECFQLAAAIAGSYPYLIGQRDQFSMTPLQYLACNPTAFRRWKVQTRRGFIELLSNSKFQEKQGIIGFLKTIYEVFVDDSQSDERYALQEVVRRLVENDTSLDMSINSQAVIPSGDGETESKMELGQKNSQESSTNKVDMIKGNESPLLLATMSDIEEIVEAVLKVKPEALKHTNKEGMNILHIAILYRHVDIFDMVVEEFEVHARRLLSATDNEKNSVLHMVSQKQKSQASEKMQSPALQLRNELLLFEKVKSASKKHISKPLNKDNKTAEELFATANEQLHQDAKEWLMRTSENCTILSVFIATVAFAAAYTVPGGPDQNTGIPILQSKPFFLVFAIADVISLVLALTSVGIFLSILTSSFPLQDFKMYLFKKLIQGIICLVFSVSTMAVAFGATIVLMMSHGQWENVLWISVLSFLPVPIFFLSYSPLRSAVLGPCREWSETLLIYFIVVVFLLIALPPFLLYSLIYLLLKGLVWTLKKGLFVYCTKGD